MVSPVRRGAAREHPQELNNQKRLPPCREKVQPLVQRRSSRQQNTHQAKSQQRARERDAPKSIKLTLHSGGATFLCARGLSFLYLRHGVALFWKTNKPKADCAPMNCELESCVRQ
jgi:hypothetical protein